MTIRSVNRRNENSCQPCGCDPGAEWICALHQWATNRPALCVNIDGIGLKEEPVSEPRTKATHPADAPNRCTTLPADPAARKNFPVASGVLDYFPDALVAIAEVSKAGNDQHNPGEPLHWARGKSTDQDDTIIRHFLERGLRDKDGMRHSAKLAWRVLAFLQLEIEAEQAEAAVKPPAPSPTTALTGYFPNTDTYWINGRLVTKAEYDNRRHNMTEREDGR